MSQLSVLPRAPQGDSYAFARCAFILAAAEVLARVRVLNARGEIPPGETGFAQLRFETPVVAVHDERFIIRSYSPAETVGGGLILDPQATKHRGREMAKIDERLRALLESDRPGK